MDIFSIFNQKLHTSNFIFDTFERQFYRFYNFFVFCLTLSIYNFSCYFCYDTKMTSRELFQKTYLYGYFDILKNVKEMLRFASLYFMDGSRGNLSLRSKTERLEPQIILKLFTCVKLWYDAVSSFWMTMIHRYFSG